MTTLLIRTKDNLNTLRAQSYSGNWILTDEKIINALIRNGRIQIHPICKGAYMNVLDAEITNITNCATDPRRKVIHFKNANIIAAPVQYKTPWCVKIS